MFCSEINRFTTQSDKVSIGIVAQIKGERKNARTMAINFEWLKWKQVQKSSVVVVCWEFWFVQSWCVKVNDMLRLWSIVRGVLSMQHFSQFKILPSPTISMSKRMNQESNARFLAIYVVNLDFLCSFYVWTKAFYNIYYLQWSAKVNRTFYKQCHELTK